MIRKNQLGSKGEIEARRYLHNNGYLIVEQNCRIGGSEIDIIATNGEFLVFIEVKSRSSPDFGAPEEFVDFRKRKKIISGARLFSARKKYRDMFIRFDIISVVYNKNEFKIEHIEDAFEEQT